MLGFERGGKLDVFCIDSIGNTSIGLSLNIYRLGVTSRKLTKLNRALKLFFVVELDPPKP